MGFDNECIVNIQSLTGEYFCPVCRTLVYPNEALQSQCTHLYCKPCLTYVVGTTKACPYDGYLVTEVDSKPLIESDKALADRIGKTLVHCLFHRSGCSWQGPLSECTSHCSGCSFGNSPVVCNRCGIQIVHRQVQEHAQICAVANPQSQQTAESSKDAATSVTATTTNSSQTSFLPVVNTSQAQGSQTTTGPPAQDANPQVQSIASGAGSTAKQGYPQHFQQYYQQYPGYDPYQQSYQQYYPYQQQSAQQLQQYAPNVGQPQVYAQHQTAIQAHHQPLTQGLAQTHPQMQPLPQSQAQQQQPSQNQLQILPQGQPQAQSYVQNQVNPQQQYNLVTKPHPQPQPNTHPAAQGQIPPQQPYPQAQPHLLPHHHIQPPAQQNFEAPQYQQALSQGHQAQLQVQPQPHSHPQQVLPSHTQSQPQSHPHSQQPHVPGYQSHPPVQPHKKILQAPPQHHPIHMHPSSGSFPSAALFPQQSPHMRPPQANASVPNQQQPNLMPIQSQIHGVPPAQHQQIHPQTPQQGHIGHQRSAAQPMQHPLEQYGQHSFPIQASGSVQGPLHQIPYAQQPMQAQSRPQGPTQHSSVQAHGMPPHQPQTYAGRPVATNQAATSQPFPQSSGSLGASAHPRPMPLSSVQPSGHHISEDGIGNQQQVSSVQQFSQSDLAIKHNLGEGNAAGQEVGTASNRIAGKDVSSAGADSVRVKALESETGGKSGDDEHSIRSDGENNGTHKGIRGKVAEAEVDALKVGSSEPSMKKIMKEEDGNGNLDPSPGGNKIESATLDERDDSFVVPKQAECSSLKDSTSQQTEAYMGHKKDHTNVRTHEKKVSHEQVNHQGPAINEYGGFRDKGIMNSSNPVPLTDQGRYQLTPGPYGPSSYQQRPTMPSNLQSGPYPGAPPNALLLGQGPSHLRPQGPGVSAPLRQSLYPSEHFQQSNSSHDIPFGGHAAPESVHPHESSEGVQRRQHYQNNTPHSQPVFSRTLKAEPTGGPLHGSDGAARLQNQMLHHFDGRYPDPHVPFDRRLYGQPLPNENRAPGFDAVSGLHAKNVNDDHQNLFFAGPAGRIGQGEYEEVPKHFTKSSLLGVEPPANFGNGFSSRAGDYPPHELNHDTPSRFLPPYHPSGAFQANNLGERPTGFHEDRRARGDSARTQPDFHGFGPGFGVVHLPPRSPGREYHDIPSRGFESLSGGPLNHSGLDDIHGRDTHAVYKGSRSSDISSDPVGRPIREQFRNGDMVGQDFMPNHLRRGELFGPRNVQSHLRAGDGFGTFPDPRMGELTGHGVFPHAESFIGNKSNHPRLGEPGFWSSNSLHGFPSDGFHAGNLDSFDRFRKRMPTSMGWCRICRVDCDTVDGLDLHSQTAEHQQRTMDMVISIKQQNAKRQRTSKEHSSIEEGSRPRNAGNRGRGKKS